MIGFSDIKEVYGWMLAIKQAEFNKGYQYSKGMGTCHVLVNGDVYTVAPVFGLVYRSLKFDSLYI